MHNNDFDGDNAVMLIHDGKASMFGVKDVSQIEQAVKEAKEKGAETLTISLDDRGIDSLIKHFELSGINSNAVTTASWEREHHESQMEIHRNTYGEGY